MMNPNRGYLRSMYGRHLVSPENRVAFERVRIRLSELDTLFGRDDHDHFGGSTTVRSAIAKTHIVPSSKVCDLGSGIGGASFQLSSTTGCSVVGIELQRDRVEYARAVSTSRGLWDKASFVCADVETLCAPSSPFTHVLSLLTLLHLRDKVAFLRKLPSLLVPCGGVFIDDFVRSYLHSKAERRMLLATISCPDLLTRDKILTTLESVNLPIRDDNIVDMTSEWAGFARKRVKAFEVHYAEIEGLIGDKRTASALRLYRGIATLFDDGVVHGIRLWRPHRDSR